MMVFGSKAQIHAFWGKQATNTALITIGWGWFGFTTAHWVANAVGALIAAIFAMEFGFDVHNWYRCIRWWNAAQRRPPV